MPRIHIRFTSALVLSIACLAFASPSFAVPFTVHSAEFGERITLTGDRDVWTAQLDISLEGGPMHSPSYCVDLATHIDYGTYDARAVLDAHSSPSPADERARDFAWAGHVMDDFGYDIGLLAIGQITRAQAITGVQAAIWEGIYGGNIIVVESLSRGAQEVFRMIMSSEVGADGPALIVDLVRYQDQVIRGTSAPVPEPSAALVFGVGTLIAGGAVRRRSR